MLCAVVLLEGAVFAMRGLARLAAQLHEVPGSGAEGEGRDSAIGGSIWSGITRTLASPYLLNISLFLLLFSITSTFLYFEQAGIAKRSFPDKQSQTAFFATVDLAVNVLTLGVQLFLTGRIVGRLGVGITLALLPAFSILGFAALAFAPTIGRHRGVPGVAPGGQLRHRPANPRGTVHRRPAGGPLQGQELHRHGGLPLGRSGGRVVLHGDRRAGTRDGRGLGGGGAAVGGVAREQPVARAGAGAAAGRNRRTLLPHRSRAGPQLTLAGPDRAGPIWVGKAGDGALTDRAQRCRPNHPHLDPSPRGGRDKPDNHTSRFATLSAFSWMNSRRGSTTSPIT